ncbi:MAG TPA: hypothetical protein VM692_02840, partial [Gammaproteobacteria bacterium]|nr:hypothetical protein [Gammaproteobacteria bacterium]
VETALAELPAAEPAYEKCWWPAHDARNRRWIAAAQPVLAAHEEALTARLTELYGEDLARPFPVDVVSYGSFSGADSVVDPNHLLVSSVVPANTGNAALEILFHEASHTVFGPGLDGRLWTELEAAAKADGAPLPRDFWHAMLFYTTGRAVQAQLAERGIDYQPYVYAQGLFERSWPWFREPLERWWQPYLGGSAPRMESLRQLVAAHKLPDRGGAFVAASRTFVFYSDLVTNLHDFLVWNARSPEPIEPASDCLAQLPDAQRAAFTHARDYYAGAFANGAGELVLLSMRWRLAKLGDVSLTDGAQIDAAIAELAPATPAYEACWWREHDARNRRWIASVLPLLEANESPLRVRLAELYGQELARSLPVDVVGYAGIGEAATVVNPPQLLISSAAPANAGNGALEVVLHEASHTLFGPRTPGPLWTALQQASSAAAKPLADELTHLLLSVTTGKAVQARFIERGIRDYEPYVYREGLFGRAPPALRDVLERVWLPSVDARVPTAEAVRQLVEALPAPVR